LYLLCEVCIFNPPATNTAASPLPLYGTKCLHTDYTPYTPYTVYGHNSTYSDLQREAGSIGATDLFNDLSIRWL